MAKRASTSLFTLVGDGDSSASSGQFLPLAGGTMLGPMTLAGNATNPLEPVTFQQFQTIALGTPKGSVHAASTSVDGNIALTGQPTLDGSLVPVGQTVLLQFQTNPIENGLWVTAAGAWSRPLNFATGLGVDGAYVSVINGATYGGELRQQVQDPCIVDTDPQSWDFLSETLYTAGAGLALVANEFSIATGGIVNSMVSASAAISGTKIDSDFGSQTVQTTGIGIFASISANGTAGSGFLDLARQNATPTAPASGLKVFSSNSDGLSFIGAAGNSAEFRPNLLTGNHIYNLPNANGILALIPGAGFVTSNGTSLSNQPTIDLGLDVSGILDYTMGGTGSTGYTAGSVIFANASQLTEDNANFFYDDANNRLGLGTTSPSFRLQLGGTGGSAYLQRDPLGAYISGSANSPTKLVVETTFGSGTAAEIALSSRPSGAMGAFEELGWLSFFGRDDAGNQRRGAYIRGITSGAWTSTSLPTHMDFFTVPSGSNSEIQRARLFSSGEFYIGSTGLVGNSGTLQVGTLSSAKIGLYMQMQSGQTADAMRIVNSSSIPFFTIDADGDIAGKSLRLRATDSTGVIQIDAQTTGSFTAPPNGFKFSANSTGKPVFINTSGNSVTFDFANTGSRTYSFIDNSYLIANVPATTGPVKSSGSDLYTGLIDLPTETTGTLDFGRGGTGATSIAAGIVTSNGGLLSSTAFPSSGVVTSNGSALSSYVRQTLRVTSTQTNSTLTPAAITSLTTSSLAPGNYRFSGLIVFQSAATGTGIALRMAAGSATISSVYGKFLVSQAANGTAQAFQYDQLSAATNVVSASVIAANTDALAFFEGTFTVSVAGTMNMQFRSETNAVSVSIRSGSYMVVEAI